MPLGEEDDVEARLVSLDENGSRQRPCGISDAGGSGEAAPATEAAISADPTVTWGTGA